jgi:protein-S-isoprenylcysteine O-methyltransferase Ste14
MDNHAKGRLLVTVQFLLLGGIAFITSDNIFGSNKVISYFGVFLELAGFALVIVGFRGLGPALTANPVPLKTGKLVTTGIYRKLRHPIYAGLIVATLGIVVANGAMIKFVFWVPLVLLLTFKIKFEEALLVATYPAYAKYQTEVGALIPKFKN